MSPTAFTRSDYRQLVELFAERARTILPACSGRIDNAVALVLANDVTLIDACTAVVHSASEPTRSYTVNGSCPCQDYSRAPSNWCKHRIAAGLVRRVEAVLQGTLKDPRIAQEGFIQNNGHAINGHRRSALCAEW
jgi:hypothetical protein